MYKEQYAVVRDMNTKTFRKWHDTEEEARTEAERLCRQEHDTFVVVKSIGSCHVTESPVTWD